MFCIYHKLIETVFKKEVLYRKDSFQAGGLKVLPNLNRGGRGESVKAD
jgi:hypothetical protein